MVTTQMKPIVFGAKGTRLSNAEAAFYAEHRPAGFIIFRRNVEDPDQLRALIAEMKRAADNPGALVLIDQEGGRVARLRPPHWREYPRGAEYGRLWRLDPTLAGEAAFLGGRLIAEDLQALGINVDCLPVLDVPVAGASNVIGDRAYGTDPAIVMALGRAAAEGLAEGGVIPIVKHIPGHGRAMADSHLELPIVDATRSMLRTHDFAPFRALNDLPLAMSAHVIYTAYDPAAPATTSPKVVQEVIRGEIGFRGLLVSDDLSMKALSGDYAGRRAASLAAGCDLVLHCNGEMAEMEPVAQGCPALDPAIAKRLDAMVAAARAGRKPIDRGQAEARLAELLAIGR
ncbi:MAG: beta-N-acetylhexosaminidase [Proteobacteria bacterium]|nr:beta-N-acetylhexosaminidase [Pseudomonadota bacterium]